MRQKTQPNASTMSNFKPWIYERVDVRDDVELIASGMNDHPVKIEVWKVTSGDSGKMYYVQILTQGTSKGATKYWYCFCPNNFPMIPLEMFHLGTHCKHIENLKVFLKDRGKL